MTESTFPTFAACTTCEARWPAAILDNFGRCPQCGLDRAPTVTATFHPGTTGPGEGDFTCAFVTFVVNDDRKRAAMYRSEFVCLLHDEHGFTWPLADREANRLWDAATASTTRTVTVPW